ncbi:MAG: thrombospondin type 3 repeat-containing protein [archaeon]|nr:thrombospondin type 3 repeat-containing protein [archaeon]
MRSLSQSIIARGIIVILLFSVLTPILLYDEKVVEEKELDELDELDILSVSGRAKANHYLTSAGGTGFEYASVMAGFGNGNIVAGDFGNTATFGLTTISPTSPYHTSCAQQLSRYCEFFLASVSETGSWNWVATGDHANGYSFVSDVAAGIGGEAVIGGFFSGSVQFGIQTITSQAGDGYLAKTDPFGNFIWAHSHATTGTNNNTSSVDAVEIDMNGDIIIAGAFNGNTDFGGTSINAVSPSIYVAKYDGNNGQLIWVISGGSGNTGVLDLHTSMTGEIVLAGINQNAVTFGQQLYANVGVADSFLLELDTNGAIVSLVGYGVPNEVVLLTGIAEDMNGNMYYVGGFGGTLQGQGWSLSASQGNRDAFLIMDSVSGNGWATSGGSSNNDSFTGVALLSTGEVIVSATISSSFTAGSNTASPTGNADILLGGLDSTGAWSWLDTSGSSADEVASGISVNMSDIVTVAGGFSGTVNKGTFSVTTAGSFDVFLWAFDPATKKDMDNDGIPDINDNCPSDSNPTQANTDFDSQGDACDSDDDNDGLTDNFPDNCPRGGEYNWTSTQDTTNPSASTDWDNDGCKDDTEDLDDDNDLIVDTNDLCPWTGYNPPRPTWVSDQATDVDGDGCRDSDEDLDDDADSVDDVLDDCPTVAGNSTLGQQGCVDQDGDGWSDLFDDCPTQAGNSTLGGKNACLDTDTDGWADVDDAFPTEISQWDDTDGDGYGDNSQGVSADDCPTMPGTSNEDRLGCFDADEDGYSDADSFWTTEDGADAFSNDPAQWSDYDEDGFGDNAEGTKGDNCPNVFGMSEIDRSGCPDSDGDYLSNPDVDWTIEMGADSCPDTWGNSTNDRIGCYDADGDGWSNPSEGWTIEMGADAYPDDAARWVKEASNGGSSTAAISTGVIAGGISVVLIIIGAIAFVMLRRKPEEVQDKSWIAGSPMPEMPNMGAQPTQAVAMPDFSAQPTQAVAQQYVAPVAIAPAVVAQPQPVVQPDPARDYYNDLVAKGYPAADAMAYTRQYYPTFQA